MQSTDEKADEVSELRSDENTALEMVRMGVREAVLTKRKEDRASAWNKNRTNLGEFPGDKPFSTKYVSERAKLLKRKRISLEDYRYLPNVLIQCEENINSFLKVDQGLLGLIRDLSGNNPIFQLYAANCCCNIALGNEKACATLGKVITPYLLIELESLNYPLLDVCIWTIGNLIAGSNKTFSILRAQHCLKYLILLLADCDSSILPSVIYAILHYIHVGFYTVSETEMAELVYFTVKRRFLYKDPNVAWLLALLSSSTICTIQLHTVLPQVADYLYCSSSDEAANISEITASIRILANTLYISCEDEADVLLKNPKYSQKDLCALLNKLLSHQYIHIRKETLWLIGNLCNHNSTRTSKNIKDIIPFLSSLNQAVLLMGKCT